MLTVLMAVVIAIVLAATQTASEPIYFQSPFSNNTEYITNFTKDGRILSGSFEQAKEFCEGLNYTLPQFRSKKEQDTVVKWIVTLQTSNSDYVLPNSLLNLHFWLNACCNFTLFKAMDWMKMRWSDGTPAEFENWNKYPRSSDHETALALSGRSGYWYDRSLFENMFFVCQRDKSKILMKHLNCDLKAPVEKCIGKFEQPIKSASIANVSTWSTFQSPYSFDTVFIAHFTYDRDHPLGFMTFPDAKAFCEKHSFDLPKTRTLREQSSLRDWIYYENHDIWLNAIENASTNSFDGWADGTPFEFNLNDGQRASSPEQRGLQLFASFTYKKLGSVVCQQSKLKVLMKFLGCNSGYTFDQCLELADVQLSQASNESDQLPQQSNETERLFGPSNETYQILLLSPESHHALQSSNESHQLPQPLNDTHQAPLLFNETDRLAQPSNKTHHVSWPPNETDQISRPSNSTDQLPLPSNDRAQAANESGQLAPASNDVSVRSLISCNSITLMFVLFTIW